MFFCQIHQFYDHWKTYVLRFGHSKSGAKDQLTAWKDSWSFIWFLPGESLKVREFLLKILIEIETTFSELRVVFR